MAPEPSRVHEHVFANSLGESRASRTKPKVSRATRASACARSTQAEQPSVIGNLIEQSLLLARKTWPMLAGVREPVRGPVKGKRNQS